VTLRWSSVCVRSPSCASTATPAAGVTLTSRPNVAENTAPAFLLSQSTPVSSSSASIPICKSATGNIAHNSLAAAGAMIVAAGAQSSSPSLSADTMSPGSRASSAARQYTLSLVPSAFLTLRQPALAMPISRPLCRIASRCPFGASCHLAARSRRLRRLLPLIPSALAAARCDPCSATASIAACWSAVIMQAPPP